MGCTCRLVWCLGGLVHLVPPGTTVSAKGLSDRHETTTFAFPLLGHLKPKSARLTVKQQAKLPKGFRMMVGNELILPNPRSWSSSTRCLSQLPPQHRSLSSLSTVRSWRSLVTCRRYGVEAKRARHVGLQKLEPWAVVPRRQSSPLAYPSSH